MKILLREAGVIGGDHDIFRMSHDKRDEGIYRSLAGSKSGSVSVADGKAEALSVKVLAWTAAAAALRMKKARK